ncbi:mycofactocin biosynthesis peptidyl-dipeptidase MftE [Antrihabitans sp. YC2-6]|uniref:mycofactocin biosynthesis peptidyl-dipeptidase MftE n=1 Tax=Antrihabitans sp. YC2-6 TaxID=2799498 RepID=UPI0018F35885|nr:mycofactocin biosynthesis peptidyl-dipeptidase MftE [Antrihabitans sp. YC2-6]MBJ8348018.1 mycofactocin biosynthesis peptidyl-dipeptidase MftE [Antrihabitans sp. YC2-6]
MAHLAQQTWTAIEPGSVTVAVPVGSIEQHGPHLPLDTDTVIARAVTESLAGVLAAPAIAYGASGEHEQFPGTVSIGREALELLLLEYGRSACRWAARLLFVNGHGGNAEAVSTAVTRLRYEGRDVAWLPCAVPGADAHAGRTETSLMLHIAPAAVRMERVTRGNTDPIGELLPRLRSEGVRALSANGILGDPAGASAAEGEQMFEGLIARFEAAIGLWRPNRAGMLV